MTERVPFDVAAYERAVSGLAAASSAASWPANRAWTMSCSTTMAPMWRPLDGSMDGRSDMLPPLDPPGCADRRTCNVNLDDLRWDRPDLDCEFEQARGIRRNLQLDETLMGGVGVPGAGERRKGGGTRRMVVAGRGENWLGANVAVVVVLTVFLNDDHLVPVRH
jgi:hypothetical protein